MKYKAIRGMNDIFPPDTKIWNNVESIAHYIFDKYGYEEIRTPILEKTELFVRTVGESTAIVEKEMYNFEDKGGDNLCLRPEATASVVRSYIESGRPNTDPVTRVYYKGPMFRHERPQKGRLRQFHQIGVELFGVDSAFADVEVISTFVHFLKELKIKHVQLEINSIGCKECRPSFNKDLISYLKKKKDDLCEDCIRRIEKNPMRAFDCKKDVCITYLKKAPTINTYWCETCNEHFEEVKKGLNILKIPFIENLRIVRGLDYYIRTAFEFTTDKLGSQNAIAAGGRYDGLVKSLGGPDIPGVGYAIGLERLILLLEEEHGKKIPDNNTIFFAVLGKDVADKVLSIIHNLRQKGQRVEWDFGLKSLKAQMRRADKVGANKVVIIGEDELKKEKALVRDMKTKEQKEVKLEELNKYFL